MDRAWYWKAGLILAVTVLSVWALVPSVTYFRLPAAERNEASVFEKARPKWAPAKHLNLGLDLQGGIHLVMGVEVDRAVREKAVRRAEEIAAEMDRKDVKGVDVKGDPDTGIVTVTAPDIGKAKDVLGEFTDMYVRRTTGNTVELAMKDDAVKQLKESAVEQAVKAIRNRVDKWGVSEPTIAKRGDASILVQLPGYSNPEKAKELIGKTAQLEFKIVDDTDQSFTQLKDLPQGIALNWDRYTGAGDATVSSPYLESKDRALLLKSGALPAPVRILEERSVGASLGPELIRRGSMAAMIGLLAVLVFMALYYRFSGVVADIALVLNGLVVLAIMAAINSTLTLPGIAGFVLTLGMAVDANVLINERIREELKTGRNIVAAVKTGYEKVFWTIFDGHVTALVAGFVIRAYGSGPVRGFATTLIIGLLASMFTSIVVTRAIVEWFVSHGRLHKAVSF